MNVRELSTKLNWPPNSKVRLEIRNEEGFVWASGELTVVEYQDGGSTVKLVSKISDAEELELIKLLQAE